MFKPRRMYDCCICGKGFKMTDLQMLDMKHVDIKLRRHLNTTLCELHLCKNCRRKCPFCFSLVPNIQLKNYGKCVTCMNVVTKRKITKK